MAQGLLRVGDLPAAPLDAAARFHSEWVPQARALFAMGDIALVLPPAAHEHQGWRLAAVQELAREAAPARVNGVAGIDEAAIAETVAYLAAAPGITGQLLAVGGIAGKMD